MAGSDRENVHTRQLSHAAGNEVPAERANVPAAAGCDAVGNEIADADGRGRDREPAAERVSRPGPAAPAGDSATVRSTAAPRTAALHRVHRGVYLVGHEALAPLRPRAAALLACGEAAVVSHSSAAVPLAARVERPSDVHVTVDRSAGADRGRACVCTSGHGARPPETSARIDGLPVTSPARTLLDLAATRYPDLERAFADAHAQRLLEPYDAGRRRSGAPAPAAASGRSEH